MVLFILVEHLVSLLLVDQSQMQILLVELLLLMQQFLKMLVLGYDDDLKAVERHVVLPPDAENKLIEYPLLVMHALGQPLENNRVVRKVHRDLVVVLPRLHQTVLHVDQEQHLDDE